VSLHTGSSQRKCQRPALFSRRFRRFTRDSTHALRRFAKGAQMVRGLSLFVDSDAHARSEA
jgi:hypothetical protein